MAENRYHMETIDSTQYVQTPHTILGRQFLEGLRKGRPDLFKKQRIASVHQTNTAVPIGQLIHCRQ